MVLQNDFKRQWELVQESALEAIRRVGASGRYILGQEVEFFEAALARFSGMAHAVGVGNGMDALEISLRCLGLEKGDKVLTTPLSAFATTLAILRAGGFPVFVDVDELGALDLRQCRQLLEHDNSIRFLVPVHLYGFPMNLHKLARLREDFGLSVVEDCAQAIGASYAGAPVGKVGQAAATSFYPTKNLGALGDGGAVLSNDAAIAERAKILRDYGQSGHYAHTELGLNSRLDEIQAALLRDAFLPYLSQWTESRRRVARVYHDQINHPNIQLLRPSSERNAIWHLFPVLCSEGKRASLLAHLRSCNVVAGIHYPRLIPDQVALAGKGLSDTAMELFNARRFANNELSLPVHPFLTEHEVNVVIDACNNWRE
jgi:dTDP-3-amino-3,4,6-trideoxy-alpha-D-glucose transaminase